MSSPVNGCENYLSFWQFLTLFHLPLTIISTVLSLLFSFSRRALVCVCFVYFTVALMNFSCWISVHWYPSLSRTWTKSKYNRNYKISECYSLVLISIGFRLVYKKNELGNKKFIFIPQIYLRPVIGSIMVWVTHVYIIIHSCRSILFIYLYFYTHMVYILRAHTLLTRANQIIFSYSKKQSSLVWSCRLFGYRLSLFSNYWRSMVWHCGYYLVESNIILVLRLLKKYGLTYGPKIEFARF